MSNQASIRGAVGAVLGTVATAAITITSLFDTTGKGVGMLNKYVSDAAEKQGINSDYEMAHFEDNLIKQVSLTAAKQDAELEAFFAAGPKNKDMFKAAHDRIMAAVNKRRGNGDEVSA